MRLGVIGCGNMGGAMLRKLLDSKKFAPQEVIVSDKNQALLSNLQAELGICAAENNAQAANADILLLAVKPQFIEGVIAEISPFVKPETLVISIVLGYDLKTLAALLKQEQAHIIRVMPNTPALVGEGVMAACRGEYITDAEWDYALSLLASMGIAEEIPEHLIDAVTGVSGSSPAFMFLFLEALADAGVRAGLPRDTSIRFAAQTMLGSAKMALETGKHPGQLKDMVTSPAGSTIEGIASLEKNAFRGAVIEAADAVVRRSKEFHK